jgi:LysR family nitrogen assimilation transcriptional regulator
VVEALSAHVAEWIATGRVDIGLLYNPEPHAALETEPLRAEPLCLVSAATVRGPGKPDAADRPEEPIALAELVRLPLVIPERSHAIRRLVEAQSALAGIKLNVAWEISSVPAILALVAGGHGHAVLARDALSGEWLGKLQARPVVEPALVHTLCLATSATKRVTPLQKSVLGWLRGQLRGR